MWGATAGRAVVALGGQEEARAARAPHTNKAGRCFSVGRDRRARLQFKCGARPPGALAVQMWGATAGRACSSNVGRDRRTRCRCARKTRRSARGARAPHEQSRALLQCGARPPGAPAAQMWGATAGRAVVALGRQEEARAARAPHTNKAGRCFNVGRDRRARLQLKCGARPPGALSLHSEDKKKRARRARPTRTKQGAASVWGATAGRACSSNVGRDRRARCRCTRKTRRSARGARAPHEQSRALLQCGARPPGAPAAQMWGATAGRAVVALGGQEEARAARAPHTNKAGRCFNVGRDRRARLQFKCGARPPGALSLHSEGKKKRARRARPTSSRQDLPSSLWGASGGRETIPVRR